MYLYVHCMSFLKSWELRELCPSPSKPVPLRPSGGLGPVGKRSTPSSAKRAIPGTAWIVGQWNHQIRHVECKTIRFFLGECKNGRDTVLFVSNYIYIYMCIYIYIHACMHACIHIHLHTITYHYIPLHTITYHYIPLHTITYHYIPLHTITYHYITLHYITLHYIHYITYITLHYSTVHYITLHYITYITLHYITLH